MSARTAASPVFDAWGRNPAAPWTVRLGALAIASALRAVYATLRREYLQPEVHAELLAAPPGRYIGVFWHSRIALPVPFFPGVPHACLVSRSRDGELLARVMVHLGSRCVRGSSAAADGRTKGGAVALRGMARAADEGFHLVVTPDGPKGPPGRMKMGVVMLGAMTGRPIVPLGFAASRYFEIPTWDRTVFPLPFSRVVLCYGELLEVSAKGDADALERDRAELERRLLAADARARAALGPEGGR